MHFTWTHCICTYTLMYIRRLIKVQHIHLVNSIHALTWHSKSSARVPRIKYLFIFSLRSWLQTLLTTGERTFISFFKPTPSARSYLELLKTIPRLNLKTVCINGLLCYTSFCFLHSSVFFSYFCICQLYFKHFHM